MGGNSDPDLDVVIVNWFAGPLLERCVESLAQIDSKDLALKQIIVVDHGSAPGEMETLRRLAPSGLRILEGSDNPGYGAGANRGAAAGSSPSILFLNPDVEITKECLETAVRRLCDGGRERLGLVSVALLGADGGVSRSCARFPGPELFLAEALGLPKLFPRLFKPLHMTDWDHGQSRDVDHAMGAFWLIRRETFETLGGFDEDFFVYLEDLDFSKRLSELGLRSLYLAEASVCHVGGGTTRRLSPGHRLAFWMDARMTYARKHFGPLGRVVTFFAVFAADPMARFLWGLVRGSTERMKSVKDAFRIYLFHGRGRRPLTIDEGRGP